MAEIIFFGIYGLAALLVAVGLIFGFAATLHWGHRREESLIPYIVYPVIIAVAIGTLLSGRNLYLPSELFISAAPKHSVVVWVTRFTSIFILVVASERIIRRLLLTGKKPDIPVTLILAFCLYFFTNVLTSALLGTHPSFSHENIYTFLAGLAALMLCRKDGETALESTRNALFFFLILSAVCAAWRPELVLSRDYQGLIPGLKIRYAGLSNHANALGPLVIVYLLCLWSMPFQTRLLNRFAWTIGLISIFLAQSKTSWIAFILCMSCVGYYKYRELLQSRINRNNLFLISTILLAGMMFALSIPLLIIMFGGDLVANKLTAFFNTREGADLLTLTGRDQIWEAATREWRANPMFGYGLTIWSDSHRAQIGLVNAYHAHNQFFQTLASTGLVGVFGLTVYALTLTYFSYKTAECSQGLTLAIFMLLLIRSISEVPMTIVSFGTEQLTHLILLMIISAHTIQSKQASPTPPFQENSG